MSLHILYSIDDATDLTLLVVSGKVLNITALSPDKKIYQGFSIDMVELRDQSLEGFYEYIIKKAENALKNLRNYKCSTTTNARNTESLK